MEGNVLAGTWENSSVVKITKELAVLNSIDFFTPIIDEPIIQGQIAASNVTSDIYAMGVTNIVSMLSILAYPQNMPTEIAVDMLKGFSEFCQAQEAPVVGGHTIMNPWPIIGGCATGVGDPKRIVYTRGAKPDDVLVLTKPLGIEPAMAAYRLQKDEKGKGFLENIPKNLIDTAIAKAVQSMITSNKPVAEVMQEIKVNAATDITGFGFKGHAENMAKLGNVNIQINALPVFTGTSELADLCGYPLLTGEAAETAGGMLIAVSKRNLKDLVTHLEDRKIQHYQVGKVVQGNGQVKILDKLEIIEA